MVHVRVSQKDHIDLAGCDRQRLILIKIRTLLHSAVNQNLLTACFKIITASRYFMRRSQKCQFHTALSFQLH